MLSLRDAILEQYRIHMVIECSHCSRVWRLSKYEDHKVAYDSIRDPFPEVSPLRLRERLTDLRAGHDQSQSLDLAELDHAVMHVKDAGADKCVNAIPKPDRCLLLRDGSRVVILIDPQDPLLRSEIALSDVTGTARKGHVGGLVLVATPGDGDHVLSDRDSPVPPMGTDVEAEPAVGTLTTVQWPQVARASCPCLSIPCQ